MQHVTELIVFNLEDEERITPKAQPTLLAHSPMELCLHDI